MHLSSGAALLGLLDPEDKETMILKPQQHSITCQKAWNFSNTAVRTSLMMRIVTAANILIIELLMAVNIKITLFWGVTLCALVGTYPEYQQDFCKVVHITYVQNDEIF